MPFGECITNININDCQIGTLNENGEFKPIGKISDVKCFEFDNIENTTTKINYPVYFNANKTCEFTWSMIMTKEAKKRLYNTFLYGWRAKGFLRRRILLRAWDKRIRAAGHFKEG